MGKEFIDLGLIKGTEGSINYDLPEEVNIEDYPYVLHWCVPFSVLFNYAKVEFNQNYYQKVPHSSRLHKNTPCYT